MTTVKELPLVQTGIKRTDDYTSWKRYWYAKAFGMGIDKYCEMKRNIDSDRLHLIRAARCNRKLLLTEESIFDAIYNRFSQVSARQEVS